jgi:hypothetical protein
MAVLKTLLFILIASLTLQAQAPTEKFTLEQTADFSDKPTKLDGTWAMYFSDYRSIKIFDRGRVYITHFNPKTGEVTRHMFGIFAFDGRVLKEKIIATTESWKEYRDVIALHRIGFEGNDIYSQVGTKGQKEVWQRVK